MPLPSPSRPTTALVFLSLLVLLTSLTICNTTPACLFPGQISHNYIPIPLHYSPATNSHAHQCVELSHTAAPTSDSPYSSLITSTYQHGLHAAWQHASQCITDAPSLPTVALDSVHPISSISLSIGFTIPHHVSWPDHPQRPNNFPQPLYPTACLAVLQCTYTSMPVCFTDSTPRWDHTLACTGSNGSGFYDIQPELMPLLVSGDILYRVMFAPLHWQFCFIHQLYVSFWYPFWLSAGAYQVALRVWPLLPPACYAYCHTVHACSSCTCRSAVNENVVSEIMRGLHPCL
jgi:hypothetical protein